jgi:hypothetical protein
MIKTSLTPQNNKLLLEIPQNYVGREIEVLLYAKDELDERISKSKKTLADFAGVITDAEYQSLKNYTEEARKEWNRDF